MTTLRSKRSEIWVTVILIVMGLSCIAYSSWSWAGASAWCAQYAANTGAAGASISALGGDGQGYSDSDSDSF